MGSKDTELELFDSEIHFFAEADWRSPPDLMHFPCDNHNDSPGFERLHYIVDVARDVLFGASPRQVWNMLCVGDECIKVLNDEGKLRLRDTDGNETAEIRDFGLINQIDLLPVVLWALQKQTIRISEDGQKAQTLAVTPARFCAAYALAAAFNAIGVLEASDREYYLMQASASFGIMQSIQPNSSGALSVSVVVASMGAHRATSARWSRLDAAKALAFKRRKEFHTLSRSRAIDKMLPDILEACREAGEPLTGGDPKATVTRWFREKRIK